MTAPILSPAFKWISAATHGDVAAFAERQRQRMAAAQPQQKPDNVKLIRKGKA